jgi:hypothetical protein
MCVFLYLLLRYTPPKNVLTYLDHIGMDFCGGHIFLVLAQIILYCVLNNVKSEMCVL